ncbi:phage major tail tube protein [Eisenbergiella porci]|uniref:phage major tail tube protein n=1 Tax=Eisenbergiella porci TaxID=2652274 RepID=UPI002A81519A|nr:phage major tail tube protein [Eisenbergiella porci]
MAGTLTYPEVINNYNVYDDGDKMQGVSGEVTLPTLSAITTEISGGGVLGAYNTAVPGAFQATQMDIPFRMVGKEYFTRSIADRQMNLTLRSSIQSVDRETGGAISSQGMRVVVRGRPTAYNFGTLSQGSLMNASITLELTYIMVEIGGENLFELDKLNSIFKVNGVDLLEDIRNQC